MNLELTLFLRLTLTLALTDWGSALVTINLGGQIDPHVVAVQMLDTLIQTFQ
jgi:hypothetical protein